MRIFAVMDEKKLAVLKERLDQNHSWPGLYMFKFIVPSDNEKIARVEALFNTNTASIKRKVSSNGSYTSITATEIMMSADKVLDCYREAAKIDGLIAL